MNTKEYVAWKAERVPLWDKLRALGKWKGDYHYYSPDSLRELIEKFTPKKEEKPKKEAAKPKAKAEEKPLWKVLAEKDAKCVEITAKAKEAKEKGDEDAFAELKKEMQARIAELLKEHEAEASAEAK